MSPICSVKLNTIGQVTAAAVVPFVTSEMILVNTTNTIMVIKPPSKFNPEINSATFSLAPVPLRRDPIAIPEANKSIMPHITPFCASSHVISGFFSPSFEVIMTKKQIKPSVSIEYAGARPGSRSAYRLRVNARINAKTKAPRQNFSSHLIGPSSA